LLGIAESEVFFARPPITVLQTAYASQPSGVYLETKVPNENQLRPERDDRGGRAGAQELKIHLKSMGGKEEI